MSDETNIVEVELAEMTMELFIHNIEKIIMLLDYMDREHAQDQERFVEKLKELIDVVEKTQSCTELDKQMVSRGKASIDKYTRIVKIMEESNE